jgi:Sulfotransferase family
MYNRCDSSLFDRPTPQATITSRSFGRSFGRLGVIVATLLACIIYGAIATLLSLRVTLRWDTQEDLLMLTMSWLNSSTLDEGRKLTMVSNDSNSQMNETALANLSLASIALNRTHMKNEDRRLMLKQSVGGFVHIGKTAGSTLTAQLVNGCHSYLPHPCNYNVRNESKVSQLASAYYHVPDFKNLPQSNHSFYVVTLRDPYDRTISSFCYQHLYNILARKEKLNAVTTVRMIKIASCLPDLPTFADYLDGNSFNFHYRSENKMVDNKSCRDLARAMMHSKVKAAEHMYYSYQRILDLLPIDRQPTIYVVRQEFLWQDWVTVNKALGQEDVWIPPKGWDHHRDVKKMNQPVGRELDPHRRAIMCNALQKEYKAYMWFLRNAVNLQQDDIDKSIEIIHKSCPKIKVE